MATTIFVLYDDRSGKEWCIVMLRLSLVVIVCGWLSLTVFQIRQQKEPMMMRNVWARILLVPKTKGMTQGIEYFKATRWKMMLFLQHNNLKLWIYWFQRKIMSNPWTGTLKHVISCSVFGTDCDVTDGLHPMIFLKKKGIYSQRLRATTKILQDQEWSEGNLANRPRRCVHRVTAVSIKSSY